VTVRTVKVILVLAFDSDGAFTRHVPVVPVVQLSVPVVPPLITTLTAAPLTDSSDRSCTRTVSVAVQFLLVELFTASRSPMCIHGSAANVAPTARARVMLTRHEPVPVQSPVHPEKTDPVAAEAVRVTVVPDA